MDKTNRKWVFRGILLLALGFMAGRWTMKTVEKIEYVKGETVHDTIPKPVPYLDVQPPGFDYFLYFDRSHYLYELMNLNYRCKCNGSYSDKKIISVKSETIFLGKQCHNPLWQV